MTTDEKNLLEAIVDKNGLFETLDSLSGICGLKAEHIATNWQDVATAKHWLKAESAIDAAASKILDLF